MLRYVEQALFRDRWLDALLCSSLTWLNVAQVTRDYDEEEQGYDSEKGEEEEDERKSDSDSISSPKSQEEMERSEGQIPKKSKLNGDDHHQEDMEMSD